MIEKKFLNEFSPTHHAVLFGLIAKEIISSFGQVGINALKQFFKKNNLSER